MNGRTQNGEVCEIAGVGPVPVATSASASRRRRLEARAHAGNRCAQRDEPRPGADCGPEGRVALGAADVRRRALWPQGATRSRPCARGRVHEDEAHPARRARPVVRSTSRQEDARRLGVGAGKRTTTNGPADRPEAPEALPGAVNVGAGPAGRHDPVCGRRSGSATQATPSAPPRAAWTAANTIVRMSYAVE